MHDGANASFSTIVGILHEDIAIVTRPIWENTRTVWDNMWSWNGSGPMWQSSTSKICNECCLCHCSNVGLGEGSDPCQARCNDQSLVIQVGPMLMNEFNFTILGGYDLAEDKRACGSRSC